MTYRLTFAKFAWKEWGKLSPVLRTQFSKKLTERRHYPHVPADKLFAMKNCYKIKLRSSGYRLVYRVLDQEITVDVIAIGKREDNEIYKTAKRRLDAEDA